MEERVELIATVEEVEELILDLEEQEEDLGVPVELPEITSSVEEVAHEYDHVLELEVELLVEVRSIWS